MYSTSYSLTRDPRALGPVTCARCGCRLLEAAGSDDGAWRHFPSLLPGRDARGCRVSCVDDLHARDGHVLAGSELREEESPAA